MPNTENLVFFNKEGYPYNFRLDDDQWTGKIFFDPNSTDIFKSLSLYTLEKVDPITFTDTVDMVNSELYNYSGMTISSGGITDESVTDIKSVNGSNQFYTKWIHGTGFHKKFQRGTIVSFVDNTASGAGGQSDFMSIYYFTVLRTKKNAIMISTSTPNDVYGFVYDQITHDLYLQSHDAINIPDFGRNIFDEFKPEADEKISLVGSDVNDGVYELLEGVTGFTNVYDYDLSGGITGDTITVNLELFTERPLLYTGNIELVDNLGTLYLTFESGRNSNIGIGTKFIFEDSTGQHLLDSNEYEVESIITQDILGTGSVKFSGITYEEDDGQIEKLYYIELPLSYDVNVNDNLLFSGGTSTLNSSLQRRVTHIESGTTTNLIYLDSLVHMEDYVYYTIIKQLKTHEQITVTVMSSIDNSVYSGFTNCMSITNILPYTQEVTSVGIDDTIDLFLIKYSNIFAFNGVDVYKKGTSIVFEGLYSGQKPYFNTDLFINNTESPNDETYSDSNGVTAIYMLILKDYDLTYERKSMAGGVSLSYYADIVLDIFDDAQDFGFELTINGIQYYIGFNDNSGTTSHTLETINSFIELYESVFEKNGLDIYSGTTMSGSTTINHLFIEGTEPNVDIWEMKVKVNRNSSYTIDEVTNNFMMVTSNKIVCNTCDFIANGFSTGMIIGVSGSTLPSNDKEYNIIGLTETQLELSFQGAMQSIDDVTVEIISREYMRSPRESNDIDIYYRFRWEDDINSTMFLYDLSGENLKPWGDNEDFRYTGPIPLVLDEGLIFLNKEANKKEELTDLPYRQQTVFDSLDFKLERFDDDNINILPKPLQTFIGYNSKLEGVDQRNLIVERVDNVTYSGNADGVSLYFEISGNTIILHTTGNENFLDMGFRTNRDLRIKFDDRNPYTQTIFEDYQDFKILKVNDKKITLDSTLTEFNTMGEVYDFIFELLPERIGMFRIYGETETEDERFEENLKLLGINLTEEDEFIFKPSDVKEEGIDYRLLNRKRKEMLNVFPEIYNYVGSYKAILNSIDFFGYTDVLLTEYYRNIDETSPFYKSLKRIVIPDLNDRSVDGWSYSEDLVNRVGYIKTNLFNLTYRITDEEGNNVNLYTLREVQTKLNGLKNWLRNNVIPVNSNVRDITGVSECVGTTWRRMDSTVNVTKQVTIDTNDAVNVNYTATRNFNDNWLVSVKFYTVSGDIPEYFDLKVITYKKDKITGELFPEQRYEILKTDMDTFNFSLNWSEHDYDRFFYVETKRYNDRGYAKSINRMYRLEDGETFYFDEFKNYILINNNFHYKNTAYVQNLDKVYIIDGDGNFYIIEK